MTVKHQREYIGDTLRVLKSSNESLRGREGRVVDETKNTFRVQTESQTITILKNPCVFRIGNDTITGSTITKRPHERIQL